MHLIEVYQAGNGVGFGRDIRDQWSFKRGLFVLSYRYNYSNLFQDSLDFYSETPASARSSHHQKQTGSNYQLQATKSGTSSYRKDEVYEADDDDDDHHHQRHDHHDHGHHHRDHSRHRHHHHDHDHDRSHHDHDHHRHHQHHHRDDADDDGDIDDYIDYVDNDEGDVDDDHDADGNVEVVEHVADAAEDSHDDGDHDDDDGCDNSPDDNEHDDSDDKESKPITDAATACNTPKKSITDDNLKLVYSTINARDNWLRKQLDELKQAQQTQAQPAKTTSPPTSKAASPPTSILAEEPLVPSGKENLTIEDIKKKYGKTVKAPRSSSRAGMLAQIRFDITKKGYCKMLEEN